MSDFSSETSILKQQSNNEISDEEEIDKIDFDIDDLESLWNANIENQLLENHFLQGHENTLFN